MCVGEGEKERKRGYPRKEREIHTERRNYGRKRNTYRETQLAEAFVTAVSACLHKSEDVCVCERERQTERERQRERDRERHTKGERERERQRDKDGEREREKNVYI